MQTLGLYLHIPFCKSKCIYCDFYSLSHREERMDAYTDALCAQLAAWSGRAADFCVDTIYFGGGTPSYLGAARLERLLQCALAHYRVTPGAEITLEANPDSAQLLPPLRTLRAAGFNRISLGMQSADDALLRTIGRVHTHAQTVRAVESARAAGFDNLSLDLIYGLPGQSGAQWRETLRAALALAPEHLSCYGLKVEEGTPLAAARETLPPGDDDAQADNYLEAVALLRQNGYEHYEISNFCRPGFSSRHNCRYWQLSPYLGLGPGAHSDFCGQRFAFARDLDSFCAGDVRYSQCEQISPQERQRERVMLSLRTARGLDLASFGLNASAAQKVLLTCRSHGLAVCRSGRWQLSAEGFLVSNEIILRVLDALGL